MVAERFPDRVVLAADTIVVLGGEVIGKPTDTEDARRILRQLRGTRHSVVTGIAVRAGDVEETGVEKTAVVMRDVPDEAIDAYVATGESLGKAGAYAVQEHGDRFIERLDGSYTNVVGLPMELVGPMLAEMGISPEGQEGANAAGGVAGSGVGGSRMRKDEQ
jgi:septum formation protein